MKLKALSVEEVALSALMTIAPSSYSLRSPTGIAALLRRVAWALSPCPPAALCRHVERALGPWVRVQEEAKDEVETVLDGLISNSDLIEEEEQAANSCRRIIFLAHPAFVPLEDGQALILGSGAGGACPTPKVIAPRVVDRGIARLLPGFREDDRRALREAGFLELTREHWLRAPRLADGAARDLVRAADALAGEGPFAEAPEQLQIIDPSESPLHYRRRWTELGDRRGLFVARRPVAYGADRWCIVKATARGTARVADLPGLFEGQRACDEAWTVQAALDATGPAPQRYATGRAGRDWTVSVFGPLPGWVRRSWDLVGSQVTLDSCAGHRPLMTYAFLTEATASAQCRLLEQSLWMKPL